jgi:1-acyl-sn-glycerol-3-phosphate acyltransferase
MRFFARSIMLPIARFDVQGLEHVPPGVFMGVTNHLSSFDTLTLIAFGPIRRFALFAAIEHRSDFIAGWALDKLRVIWLRRGEADREAIRIALDEIKDGAAFGIAIEGTRSKTGALIEGKTGAAYLATRASIPILPAVIWGTEQIKHNLRKFKRTTVHIRIGEPFHLPAGRAGAEELQQYTEQIMLRLASMLPPEYWGVYAEKMTTARIANDGRIS